MDANNELVQINRDLKDKLAFVCSNDHLRFSKSVNDGLWSVFDVSDGLTFACRNILTLNEAIELSMKHESDKKQQKGN